MLISADLFCCGLVDADPVARRRRVVRHPAAGDDGRDLRRRSARWSRWPTRCPAPTARARSSAPSSAPASSSILIAPLVSRMLRFFPPVVTGTIIAVIGISLMRVGIGWAMGGPAGPGADAPTSPSCVAMVDMAEGRRRPASSCRPPPTGRALAPAPTPMLDNPNYAALATSAMPPFVLGRHPADRQVRARASSPTSSVLLGIIAGCVVAAALGKMNFDKVAKARLVRRRHAASTSACRPSTRC